MKKQLRNKIHAAAAALPVIRSVYAENAALKHALKAGTSLHEQLLDDAGRMRQARAGLPHNLDIIVPVCNASAWLPFILNAYDRLQLHPLFIVDQRSSDSSLDILAQSGARHILAPSGEQPTVESLLFPILHILRSKYILRLDDDELPSPALLAWITAHFEEFTKPVIALPRRWVARPPGQELMETSGKPNEGVLGADYQYRLFQPQQIKPVTYLHSPGFELREFMTAPSEAVIYHLDWIVRSYEKRQAKVAAYNEINIDLAAKTSKFSLPEDHDMADYGLQALKESMIIDVCGMIQAATRVETYPHLAGQPGSSIYVVDESLVCSKPG